MPTAQDMYDAYLAAELKILGGQEVRWGDRILKQADLGMVVKERKAWQAAVAKQTRASNGAPQDNIVLADFSGLPATDRFGRCD